MSRKRPTEASWDSDDDLLQDDFLGITAFSKSKSKDSDEELDEELDEEALLGSDDEGSRRDLRLAPHTALGDPVQIEALSRDGAVDGFLSQDPLATDDGGLENLQGRDPEPELEIESDIAEFDDENAKPMVVIDELQDAASSNESSDSESETVRDRFKTERSRAVVVPSAATPKSRSNIPDTLEISQEQQAALDEFMTQKESHRGNRRGQHRGRRFGHRGRGGAPPHRPYPQRQFAPRHQSFQPPGQFLPPMFRPPAIPPLFPGNRYPFNPAYDAQSDCAIPQNSTGSGDLDMAQRAQAPPPLSAYKQSSRASAESPASFPSNSAASPSSLPQSDPPGTSRERAIPPLLPDPSRRSYNSQPTIPTSRSTYRDEPSSTSETVESPLRDYGVHPNRAASQTQPTATETTTAAPPVNVDGSKPPTSTSRKILINPHFRGGPSSNKTEPTPDMYPALARSLTTKLPTSASARHSPSKQSVIPPLMPTQQSAPPPSLMSLARTPPTSVTASSVYHLQSLVPGVQTNPLRSYGTPQQSYDPSLTQRSAPPHVREPRTQTAAWESDTDRGQPITTIGKQPRVEPAGKATPYLGPPRSLCSDTPILTGKNKNIKLASTVPAKRLSNETTQLSAPSKVSRLAVSGKKPIGSALKVIATEPPEPEMTQSLNDKIAQQKKMREEIIRRKEQRRQMQAKQRRQDLLKRLDDQGLTLDDIGVKPEDKEPQPQADPVVTSATTTPSSNSIDEIAAAKKRQQMTIARGRGLANRAKSVALRRGRGGGMPGTPNVPAQSNVPPSSIANVFQAVVQAVKTGHLQLPNVQPNVLPTDANMAEMFPPPLPLVFPQNLAPPPRWNAVINPRGGAPFDHPRFPARPTQDFLPQRFVPMQRMNDISVRPPLLMSLPQTNEAGSRFNAPPAFLSPFNATSPRMLNMGSFGSRGGVNRGGRGLGTRGGRDVRGRGVQRGRVGRGELVQRGGVNRAVGRQRGGVNRGDDLQRGGGGRGVGIQRGGVNRGHGVPGVVSRGGVVTGGGVSRGGVVTGGGVSRGGVVTAGGVSRGGVVTGGDASRGGIVSRGGVSRGGVVNRGGVSRGGTVGFSKVGESASRGRGVLSRGRGVALRGGRGGRAIVTPDEQSHGNGGGAGTGGNTPATRGAAGAASRGNLSARLGSNKMAAGGSNSAADGGTATAPIKPKIPRIVYNDEDNQKSQQPASLPSTTVCIDNLSASTNTNTLRHLATNVGSVESIKINIEQKKAFIKFTRPDFAQGFIKKYNRYMLDLSHITASLVTS